MRATEVALTLVSDRRRTPGGDLPALARSAALAGIDFVQVREKDLPAGALLGLVAAVCDSVRGTPARVLVNGRPDVAVLAGASGVQLPEDGLPVAEVRRAFGQLLIGASCHSLEAARRAEAAGADFVVLGPVFATPGKQTRALGAQALAEVARVLRVPVHAIGGIDAGTGPLAVAAGAAGLAAIRAFLQAPLPEVARSLRNASEQGRAGRVPG